MRDARRPQTKNEKRSLRAGLQILRGSRIITVLFGDAARFR
jgi:hypothetical protein